MHWSEELAVISRIGSFVFKIQYIHPKGSRNGRLLGVEIHLSWNHRRWHNTVRSVSEHESNEATFSEC